jgi:integral membrane protein
MNFSSTLGALRLFGFMEGCSFLLFALTMPVKYMMKIGWPNQVVGMAHGILFIAYVMLVFLVARERKWSLSTQFGAYIASLLPFGTFVADAKIFKPETNSAV